MLFMNFPLKNITKKIKKIKYLHSQINEANYGIFMTLRIDVKDYKGNGSFATTERESIFYLHKT